MSPKSRLAFKAVIFAVLFSLIRFGNFGFWPVAIFVAAALFLYARPLFRTLDLAPLLSALLIEALLLADTFLSSNYFILIVVYFSTLFYLILGVKELAFIKRGVWARILNLALAYPAFILFFYYNQADFLPRAGLVFLAALLFTRDLIGKKIAAWLIALSLLEIIWAASLLPLGFINAANLVFLVYFILTDLGHHYYSFKNLSRLKILTNTTIFVILVLITLAFSRWSL